jgi:membrane protein implicated in regulation of membrane protease activity
MCNVIYAGLMGLLLLYGDYLLAQYGLAVVGPEGTIVVATGWETARELWPLPLLGVVVGSAVTLALTRRRNSRANSPGSRGQ